MNRDTCNAVTTTTANRVAESMLCIQYQRNNAPCAGNLGSGLYCDGRLTGVLTDGLLCDAAIGVYQQVRALNGWINATMALQNGNVPGSMPIDVSGFPRPLRQ